MRQNAAAQIPAKLLLDVAGQVLTSLLAYRPEEGLEVLAHDEMQGAVLRTVPAVAAIGGLMRRVRVRGSG
jgi:hypothetical protein